MSAATGRTITVDGATGAGTITLATTDDVATEPDGSITVTITDISGHAYRTGTPGSATVAVKDAGLGPTATVAAGTSPVTEGADAVFTVTLSRAPLADVAVNYGITVDGDYGVSAATGRTLAISSGATTGTITLPTTDDSAGEANGSVTVTLATGTGYVVGTGNSASVNVIDDDADIIPTNFRADISAAGLRYRWNAPSSGTVGGYQLRWDNDRDPENGATTVTLGSGTLQHDVLRGTNAFVCAQVRAQDDSDDTWGPWTYMLCGVGNFEANRRGTRHSRRAHRHPGRRAADGNLDRAQRQQILDHKVLGAA